MKKLLAILLLATPLAADVTTTIVFTDGQAARIERARARVNAASCAYRGLPANCNTTQLRQQYCKTNGIGGQPIIVDGVQTGTTPLVSDCNGATQFIIYPSAESFVKRTMLEKVDEWTKQDESDDRAAAKAAWDAKTQAQKDAICASLGSKSKVLTNNTPTDFATIALAEGAATGGEIIYRVVATSGTARQVISGRVRYDAARDNTTYDSSISEVGTQGNSPTTGTFSGAITSTAASDLLTFTANFNSDLTTPVVTLYWRFDSTDTLVPSPV